MYHCRFVLDSLFPGHTLGCCWRWSIGAARPHVGPCALVGAPISLRLEMSFPAALSTLGLAQQGTPAHTMLFLSFWCRKDVCSQDSRTWFLLLWLFLFCCWDCYDSLLLQLLVSRGNKTVVVLPGCPGHLGIREACVSYVSAGNPLAMPWRKGRKPRYRKTSRAPHDLDWERQ